MPIKDYSTTIPAGRTLGEIQHVLGEHGAQRVMTLYDDRQPVGVEFLLTTPYGPQRYQLPANIPAVLRVLERDKRANTNPNIRIQATHEQAARVAWRVIKDWIEAQLALVETQMVGIDRVMLPYLVLDEGQTLYDAIVARDISLALPPGGAP